MDLSYIFETAKIGMLGMRGECFKGMFRLTNARSEHYRGLFNTALDTLLDLGLSQEVINQHLIKYLD